MDWDFWHFKDVSLLSSELFRISVPVASAVVGIWIKSEFRHPDKQMIKKEDLAVGVQLIQTSCVSFLTLATQKALQLHAATISQRDSSCNTGPKPEDLSVFMAFSGFRLAFMFLILFGVASIVRRFGWKTKDDIRVFPGIAIPIVIGIVCLYTVIRDAQ